MEIKDIVKLSDDNDYQVISKVNYEGLNYYYLVDMNDMAKSKFLYEDGEDLTEIDDPELMERLIPKLFAEIKDLL